MRDLGPASVGLDVLQIIVLPRFEINGFIKMLRKHRPTMLPGVPTLFVALINDPRIILADEPTGNLDSATSEMIFQLFSELNRRGLTLVIVTHNLDLARRAQKMYTLRDGRIVGCEERECLQQER